MKKIFIASSRKFYDQAKTIKNRFDELGVVGFYPYFEFDGESVEKNEEFKRKLTLKHFPEIDQADVLYILAENGYAGISVAIEASYAYAKGKEIISSEPLQELALRAIVGQVKKPEEFICYILKDSK